MKKDMNLLHYLSTQNEKVQVYTVYQKNLFLTLGTVNDLWKIKTKEWIDEQLLSAFTRVHLCVHRLI